MHVHHRTFMLVLSGQNKILTINLPPRNRRAKQYMQCMHQSDVLFLQMLAYCMRSAQLTKHQVRVDTVHACMIQIHFISSIGEE